MVRARITTPWNESAKAFKIQFVGPAKDGSSDEPTNQRTHDERGTFQIERVVAPNPAGTMSFLGYMQPAGVGTILTTVNYTSMPASQLFINVQMWPVMGVLSFGGSGGSIAVHVVE